MVARSDGTTRFGEIVRKIGMFYQDAWEVVVNKSPDGGPGAIRKEDGVMLGRPKPASMANYWERCALSIATHHPLGSTKCPFPIIHSRHPS